MGTMQNGKDGQIESGTTKLRCTEPPKRFTKDLQIKIDASLDSALSLPKASIVGSIQQTVTKLNDYSTEGLDLQYILFQLCEISNNRGFASSQTDTLFRIAENAWLAATLQRNQKAGASMNVNQQGGVNAPFTFNNNNQQGGIAAGNLYIETPKRTLNTQAENQLESMLKEIKYDSIGVTSTLGDGESFQLAQQIASFFRNKGTMPVHAGNQAIFNPPIVGVILDTVGLSRDKYLKIEVGSKP
jgi:hypothetical protein